MSRAKQNVHDLFSGQLLRNPDGKVFVLTRAQLTALLAMKTRPAPDLAD